MFEWCRKNINAVEFILVSHEEVGSHIVDYGLEERYLMWSTVPGTSFHWYKPCSKTSFQMWHVSSDDVTILHRKSSIRQLLWMTVNQVNTLPVSMTKNGFLESF